MNTCKECISFGEFTLSPTKRILFKGKEEIKLRDTEFDVLSFLIDSSPKLCSHDEIIEKVWKVHVEDNSVDKAIANIRKALGDDKKNPRFIKTIRKKGFLFIGDIMEHDSNNKETEVNYLSNSLNGNFLFPVSTEISNKTGTEVEKTTKLRFLILCAVVLTAFAGIGIYFAKRIVFANSVTSNILFSDDFSANEIDSQKWQAKGKSIKVTDGIAVISIDETDKGGNLWSNYFSFDPNKPIIVSSRLKFNPNKNYGKYYFGGEFFLIPKVFPKESAGVIDFDWIKKATLAFGVMYNKYEYESEEEVPVEGFFLIKPGGRPAEKYSQKAGTISKPVEPIWNQWFEQKTIYDPLTGLIELTINGEKKCEFNVGQMPPLEDNKMQLQITPYGWYTNHSMEIDYIEITQ